MRRGSTAFHAGIVRRGRTAFHAGIVRRGRTAFHAEARRTRRTALGGQIVAPAAETKTLGVVDGEDLIPVHPSRPGRTAPPIRVSAALVVHPKVRRCGRREIVHHSRDAVLHQCGIEVQEETDLQVHQAEIGQQLLRVDPIETLE